MVEPESVGPASVPSEPPPSAVGSRWWYSAKGTIAVVGALSVAIPATTAATTTAVVSVIDALRQPTDPKLREDVEGTRKELAALRAYLADKDAARALELEKRLDAMSSRITDLDLRYPAPKPDPMRPPK